MGKDTDETYALCEVIVAPQGGSTPLHRHSRKNESFYVQERELESQLDKV